MSEKTKLNPTEHERALFKALLDLAAGYGYVNFRDEEERMGDSALASAVQALTDAKAELNL